MVGVTGFEPAASSSRTKRATKLRHTPCEATTAYRTGLSTGQIACPAQGQEHEFTIAEPVTYLVHPWQLGSLRYTRRLWELPEDPVPGQQLGALEVWMDGRLFAELPLYARE